MQCLECLTSQGEFFHAICQMDVTRSQPGSHANMIHSAVCYYEPRKRLRSKEAVSWMCSIRRHVLLSFASLPRPHRAAFDRSSLRSRNALHHLATSCAITSLFRLDLILDPNDKLLPCLLLSDAERSPPRKWRKRCTTSGSTTLLPRPQRRWISTCSSAQQGTNSTK